MVTGLGAILTEITNCVCLSNTRYFPFLVLRFVDVSIDCCPQGYICSKMFSVDPKGRKKKIEGKKSTTQTSWYTEVEN